MEEKRIQCQWCGQNVQLVWVHGHGQCSNCGINIDECCRGENEFDCKITIPNSSTENNLDRNES